MATALAKSAIVTMHTLLLLLTPERVVSFVTAAVEILDTVGTVTAVLPVAVLASAKAAVSSAVLPAKDVACDCAEADFDAETVAVNWTLTDARRDTTLEVIEQPVNQTLLVLS